MAEHEPLSCRIRKAMAGPHRLQQSQGLLTQRLGAPGEHPATMYLHEGSPPGSEPEAQVLEALGEEELTQRILALREPYKTPCRLMLLEQHTAAEAARLCGRPQKTVEAQVFRAKDAGRAAERRRKGGLLRWNCSVKTAV